MQDFQSSYFPPRLLSLRERHTKGLILTALILTCLASASAVLAKESPKKETKTPATHRFESEIAVFEKRDDQNTPPKDPILFVGSSTIRLWPTARAFPQLSVINRGFGGSTIADVNHFSNRIVFKYKPRLIVFYSGDNDIASGRSPEKVSNDFRTFLISVRENLRATPVIYLAIKPSVARWKAWPKMQAVNSEVKQLADDDKNLIYVDTAPSILGDDNQPRPELFRDDGLHLSEEGYAAWNELLAPYLTK